MTGRDLRSTPLTIDTRQRLCQRQGRLRRVPAARQPGGDRLSVAEFHPKAVKTQGARPIRWPGFFA